MAPSALFLSWCLRSVAAAALCCAIGTSGGAQVSKVEWKRNLLFGTVPVGGTSTILPSSGSAAHWFVEAEQGTNITLSFSLPANLVSGGNTVPITFSGTAAAWDRDSSPSGYTLFNPAQSAAITVSATKQIYVWLGGTLTPPGLQATGTYSGTITLIVTTN